MSQALTDVNLQFTDVTIESGNTLFVASGTVIRATGDCNISGDIMVQNGARGAGRGLPTAIEMTAALRPAQPGVGAAGGDSGVGDTTVVSTITAGLGGLALSFATVNNLVRPHLYGGGGGGSSAQGPAGDGGGYFALYCDGDIIIDSSAAIFADGQDSAAGGGGGGGGIIVLAATGSIDVEGSLSAVGGNGGTTSSTNAAGGGGGGGVLHFIAPVVSVTGVADVSGGLGGPVAGSGTITGTISGGGGGGGSCAGAGGGGGTVFTFEGTASGGQDGSDGAIRVTETDPTALIL
jgi:hypothetical protein